MTVFTERTDVRGDLKRHDHIKKIIDHGKYFELWINENWQTIVNKKNHKIVFIDAGDAE